MEEYIPKSALVAEIERVIRKNELYLDDNVSDSVRFQKTSAYSVLNDLLHFLDTLEVKDPYEQCVQYDSIKAGIQAHAESYSFNIESMLFHQLTKEQQKLWRKEIEQAVISGGEMGVELARDQRYKKNLEVKEVDIDKILCHRRSIGFAYPEGASEYQKRLVCYRQGIEDVLKAQKGE